MPHDIGKVIELRRTWWIRFTKCGLKISMN